MNVNISCITDAACLKSEYTRMTQESPTKSYCVFVFLNQGSRLFVLQSRPPNLNILFALHVAFFGSVVQCVAVELWIVSPGGGELLPSMFFVHPEH